MTAWAEKKGDIDLTIVDAKNDTAKQVGQVENFLTQKWTPSSSCRSTPPPPAR